MSTTQKLSHLQPETRVLLEQYPVTTESILAVIDQPQIPAQTLINSLEFFANGILVVAYIDGIKTIDVEVPENLIIDIIEVAINGQLGLAKVGSEIVVNRIDALAKASVDLQRKLNALI